MLITRIFFISLLLISTLNKNIKDNSIFISPVKIPLLLSANFGELRIDHYHSGLDIKTEGVTGKEVVATADGFIYRIGVAPGGFGRALYIRHSSGYSTVYGHLERFTPEIEEWVKSQQYERKSFLVTLYPMKDQFQVKQGAVIAYSGNSGASGGPHLHYEIRRSDNEIPVNPLLFEFGIKDDILPVIEKIVIYPAGNSALINNENFIKKFDAEGISGKFKLPESTRIVLSGGVKFGIKAFDRLNGSSNKCAVYSIELRIDSINVFSYVMDAFSFSESRYINSHIDYETYMRENVYYERMFVLPNDKLSTYKTLINNGIYNFSDTLVHNITVIVADAAGNSSSLSFNVKSQMNKSAPSVRIFKDNVQLMPYNRANKFFSDNVSLNIPAGALYDTLYFKFNRKHGNTLMLSDVYQIHNRFTPLQKAAALSVKPSRIPVGKESKLLLVQLNDNLIKNGINSTYSHGYVTGDILAFGDYYVGIDTLAPSISANGLVPGADLTGKKELRIKITDDLSGIKSYEPSIDGNWALFEFDQKNNVIIYRFDEKRIKRGNNHNLTLKVTDNKDNTNEYSCDFTW
jgi:hypothetical protein